MVSTMLESTHNTTTYDNILQQSQENDNMNIQIVPLESMTDNTKVINDSTSTLNSNNGNNITDYNSNNNIDTIQSNNTAFDNHSLNNAELNSSDVDSTMANHNNQDTNISHSVNYDTTNNNIPQVPIDTNRDIYNSSPVSAISSTNDNISTDVIVDNISVSASVSVSASASGIGSPEPYLVRPTTSTTTINNTSLLNDYPVQSDNDDLTSVNSNNTDSSDNVINKCKRQQPTDTAEKLMIDRIRYLYTLIDTECNQYWELVDDISSQQTKQMFAGSTHKSHRDYFKNNNRPQRKRNNISTTSTTINTNNSSTVTNQYHIRKTPSSVSVGYGELTLGSMDKLIKYLIYDILDEYKLNSNSIFLDIGSGFGKAVLHTAVRSKCRQSIGIEYVLTRHNKAVHCRSYLNAQYSPSINVSKYDSSITDMSNIIDKCVLKQGDATDNMFIDDINTATHIYMFDWVFSKITHQKLIPIIDNSNALVFITYQASRIKSIGLYNYQCIHQITCHTTGKQSFTASIFIRQQQYNRNTRRRTNNIDTTVIKNNAKYSVNYNIDDDNEHDNDNSDTSNNNDIDTTTQHSNDTAVNSKHNKTTNTRRKSNNKRISTNSNNNSKHNNKSTDIDEQAIDQSITTTTIDSEEAKRIRIEKRRKSEGGDFTGLNNGIQKINKPRSTPEERDNERFTRMVNKAIKREQQQLRKQQNEPQLQVQDQFIQ